jgi:hypothetical protein
MKARPPIGSVSTTCPYPRSLKSRALCLTDQSSGPQAGRRDPQVANRRSELIPARRPVAQSKRGRGSFRPRPAARTRGEWKAGLSAGRPSRQTGRRAPSCTSGDEQVGRRSGSEPSFPYGTGISAGCCCWIVRRAAASLRVPSLQRSRAHTVQRRLVPVRWPNPLGSAIVAVAWLASRDDEEPLSAGLTAVRDAPLLARVRPESRARRRSRWRRGCS